MGGHYRERQYREGHHRLTASERLTTKKGIIIRGFIEGLAEMDFTGRRFDAYHI